MDIIEEQLFEDTAQSALGELQDLVSEEYEDDKSLPNRVQIVQPSNHIASRKHNNKIGNQAQDFSVTQFKAAKQDLRNLLYSLDI